MSLDAQTVFFAIGIIAVILFLFYLQSKRLDRTIDALNTDDSRELLLQWLGEMRAGIDRNSEMVNRQLSQSNESLNQRLDSNA